jgi:hypothetical protein
MTTDPDLPPETRADDAAPEPDWESYSHASELAFYRDHTLVLLRRYFRLSLDTGRLPSLLGREIFRAKVSVYKAQTFEDAVIFVHDVERCLDQLDDFARQLIAHIVFQEYSEEETASQLGCPLRHIERYFPEALDRLTEIFLAAGVLRPLIRPE